MPDASKTDEPKIQRHLTRRHFVYLTGLAATGVVATACGGGDEPLPGQTPRAVDTTGAAQPQATSAAAQPTGAAVQPTTAAPATGGQQTPAAAPKVYKEAPQFAQMVKDGKLPPVAERLPKNPVVVKPVEKIGKYGGTWRMGLQRRRHRAAGAHDRLRAPGPLGPRMGQRDPQRRGVGHAQPRRQEYTVKLREGHKWSDGQPFTADDLVFYVEDIHKNPELTTARGRFPVEIEKIDQYTVKIKHDKPNGLFMQRTATPDGDEWTRYPAHYLKQFHKKQHHHHPRPVGPAEQRQGLGRSNSSA